MAGATLVGAAIAHGRAPREHALAPIVVEHAEEAEEAPLPPSPADLRFTDEDVRGFDASGAALAAGRVITGATPHRMILFTFDDGPDRRTTPRLLAELDRLDVRAVFFVTTQRMAAPGHRGRDERALLNEIVRRGHLIGNHTVNHEQLPLLTTEEVLAEIDGAADLIEATTGRRPSLVRPPGGSRSPRVDRLLAERGYTDVLWNLGAGDFQVRDADEVVRTFDRVLERRERENGERGGIVLLHDTHPWSVEALPRIVGSLRDRNCTLLASGEELYDIVDDPSFFFSPLEEGEDPSTLAEPARIEPGILEARQTRLRDETTRRCHALASR